MTLLHINLAPRKGIQLATDTLMIDPGRGEKYFVSKVLTLPHIRAVLACRGHALFTMMISAEIADGSVSLRSFEELSDAAPEILGRAYEKLRQFVPEGHAEERDGFAMNRNTVALLGWSSAQGCAVGRIFQRRFEDPDWTVTELQDQFWAFPGPPPAAMKMMESMVQRKKPWPEILVASAKAARDQDDMHRATIGGHLVLTTIGPDRLEQRVIHTWQDDFSELEVPKHA